MSKSIICLILVLNLIKWRSYDKTTISLLFGTICLLLFFLFVYMQENYLRKGQTKEIMDQPTEVGNWIQISTLGSGSFGTVTLWRNQKDSDFIAIKKCKFQKASALNARQKERWHMEVDFIKSINHQNIIGFKKMDPELAEMINKYNPTKLPLLSMEYCKNGNLRRYLTSEPIKLCGLPERDVRYILEDISNGLSYLHSKRITHRDIKPDNIVLQHCDNRKGETVYKIIDLGYAKELQDATLSFVGTLHYLAPEIFFNQDYSHSVDYWSMGTMVFEVICGVLPFLPEMTPYERYEKIKDKNTEDICIYISNSGAITNSSEIKREHFITSCFKQNIETWLKRVLQMDPTCRKFGNDLSVFDYLRFILDKKIIQVFSVYKQEYYSYEINDSTFFGTLKDWIARDIKVPKNDLLFLFRCHRSNQNNEDKNDNVWYCNDDNTLLQCLTSTDELILYVYKKYALFSEIYPPPKMPGLVKELFNVEAKFQSKFSINVYRQALFYVHSEFHTVVEFKNAYYSLVQFFDNIYEEISNKYVTAKNEFKQILWKLDQFLQKKKNGGPSLNNNLVSSRYPELSECLKYFERFISNVERREANLNDFGKQYKIFEKKKLKIDEVQEEITKIFEKCNIQQQFNTINGKAFFEKLRKSKTPLKHIKDIVSETLKLKYNLFNKEEMFKGFSKDFCLILKGAEQLLFWVDDFVSIIQKLSADFNNMEEKYNQILSKVQKTRQLGFDIEDTKNIIRENELLRCQFADLLSEKISSHKDFVDESMHYLNIN